MATKQDYFDAAFDMLSAQGYSALKQAPLCKRLNVTTGSFYHYFENWHDFTSQLLDHWLAERTTRLVGLTRDLDDPLEQLETLLQFSLALPHRAEAAIRVWSKVDPEVRAVQDQVDNRRTEVVLRAARAVFDDENEALDHARWAMYLLAGYQDLDADPDTARLEGALRKLLREFENRYAARPS
ncbi:TetR/AcrR family transcriptional regulator [Nocardia shimofusensis]|uniref:TetR/AcrR family transcriptional regulator n=1 Tax=Nocardia shimofusensis TaxID=228596 RepID=UPI0008371D67|nr:TetR/AcrR family transcriptional regulator [Nocardia shimofusensis]